MAKQAPQDAGTPPAIPDKLYFRIGEVAELCGVETYVLRFWETEFPPLAPKKSGTGQRLYRRRDVELALRVKRLLHGEGYTIAGARQVLAAEAQELRKPRVAQPELALTSAAESVEVRQARERGERAAERTQARLMRMKQELRELLGILSQAPGVDPGSTAGRVPGRPFGTKARREESKLFDDAQE